MLRTQLKKWEKDFKKQHGRNPTSSDVRKVPEMHKLYKEYAVSKKKSENAGPAQPNNRNEQGSATASMQETGILDQDSDQVQEADTPRKPTVSEVTPTPQHHGRVLGLFDIKLPATPVKQPVTPLKQHVMETPTSQRTPSYVNQCVTLFPEEESPLGAPRRATKSVSQLIEDSKLFGTEPRALTFDEHDAQEEILASSDDDPLESGSVEVPLPAQENTNKRKKYGRRQAKKARVVLKPVLETDVPSQRKATQNYRRLNIQKKKPFGRRN